MKIIFDRSTFHAHFDSLKGSHLLELTRQSKIIVYHTAVFLDETLRMAASERPNRRDELKRQWPFLQSICNGGWFRPLLVGQSPELKSVCDGELDAGEKGCDWPLVASRLRSSVQAKVNKFLEGSGPLPELINAQLLYDQNEQMKTANKGLRFKLRTEHSLPEHITFAQYHRANFLDAGELLIRRPRGPGQPETLAALDQPEAKFEAWKSDFTKFPHFTAFVGFFIYSLYDAEKNQNSPLDRNWQSDAEQLCFLVDVDAVISSEGGFMKRAFEALWQPSDRRFFTPEEFVTFLSQGSLE
jgi:hypothetical protein